MKATKETQDLKEELQRKEQIKEAAKKRQEKQDDLDAKRRIKAKIEADKEERRRKAEQAKAAREGRPIAAPSTSAAAAATPSAPAAPKPAATHTEARVKLQTPSGDLEKTYPAETTLFEIAQGLDADDGIQVKGFSTTFPKKTYQDGLDFSKTLKEIGCVPRAVLIVHAA
jgi:citrate synthase